MNDLQAIENVIKNLISHYGWLIIAAFSTLILKDFLHSMIAGVMIFFGNDINEDDIVFINGRKARVSRVGLRKTIFYMYDENTKMIVPNERLKNLTIEKRLSTNGGGNIDDRK